MHVGKQQSFALKRTPTSKVILVNVTWNIIMPPHRVSRGIMKYGVFTIFLVSLLTVVFYLVMLRPHGAWDVGTPYPRHYRLIASEEGQIKRRFQSKMEVEFPEDDDWSKNEEPPPAWDIKSLQVKNTSLSCGSAVLVILVTSALGNFEKREAIRNTWCKENVTAGGEAHYSVQCVFLLGQSEDIRVNRNVSEESQRYSDVLVGNFIDSYRNLSLKVFTGFSWIREHCSAKYILKTDDDCFVHTNLLSWFLAQHNTVHENLYVGNVFRTDRDTRVIRHRESKWSVSYDQFAPEHYPHYASGTGYLMSADAMTKLLDNSRFYKPFPNEDAYVGVLMERAGVTPMHSYRFTLFSDKWTVCNFLFLFVIHNVAQEQQFQFQSTAEQAWNKCAHHRIITEWT